MSAAILFTLVKRLRAEGQTVSTLAELHAIQGVIQPR
jgi:hypothetical protein